MFSEIVLSVMLCSVLATSTSCPTWHYYNNVTGVCECGFGLICGNQVEIGSTHCATNSEETGGYYIGKLPFYPTFNTVNRMYSEMPSNASQLDEVMCGPYNRKGLLCGECKDGYGPAVYSFDMKCADCSSLWSKCAIILYLFLQFVPTTLIFLCLVMFHINITSGPLLGYVLFCQISIVYIGNRYHFIYDFILSDISALLKVLFTVSTILSQCWNLQFFKAIIPPFCISEKLTNIHVLMLDFIPALYPLVLIIISCTLMELHARHYSVFPFRTIVNKINITSVTSYAVIQAFASFIWLSNISVASVVLKILDISSVHKSPGTLHKKVMYIDPTIEWPSHKVLPYLWISIVFFFFFSFTPFVLLCIYPTRVYRYLSRFLSARKRLAITAFAEALHSCFKDGLNGTRDYRALAGAPIFVIMGCVAVFTVLLKNISYGSAQIVAAVLWTLFVSVVSHVKPCKTAIANISLSFHMALFGVLLCAIYLWQYDLTVRTYTLELIFIAILLTPHILVALWAGYTLTKYTLTRCGYQFHGPGGCKMALSDMANGVRLCLYRRHSGYQELLE